MLSPCGLQPEVIFWICLASYCAFMFPVDGAIHSAAGSQLVAECRTLRGCDEGDAKITLGYKLPATHVIHTVGPQGQRERPLQSCYARCLQLVQENNLTAVVSTMPLKQ